MSRVTPAPRSCASAARWDGGTSSPGTGWMTRRASCRLDIHHPRRSGQPAAASHLHASAANRTQGRQQHADGGDAPDRWERPAALRGAGLLAPTSLVWCACSPPRAIWNWRACWGKYRIPFKSAPKVIAVDYLAFCQPASFGERGGQIEYVAEVRGHELTTRAELLREGTRPSPRPRGILQNSVGAAGAAKNSGEGRSMAAHHLFLHHRRIPLRARTLSETWSFRARSGSCSGIPCANAPNTNRFTTPTCPK